MLIPCRGFTNKKYFLPPPIPTFIIPSRQSLHTYEDFIRFRSDTAKDAQNLWQYFFAVTLRNGANLKLHAYKFP